MPFIEAGRSPASGDKSAADSQTGVLTDQMRPFDGASVLFAEDPISALQREIESLTLENAALKLENGDLRRENRVLTTDLRKVGAVAEKIFKTTDSVYLDGFDISGRMESAEYASGDFFAFFPLPLGPRYLGIAIGDVTDKGPEAAMVSVMTYTTLRTLLSRAIDYPADEPTLLPIKVMMDLNMQLLQSDKLGDLDVPVTMIYGVLNADTGLFVYARGAHPPPLLYDHFNNRIPIPVGTGQPVGMLEHPVFDVNGVIIPPDGILVMYTDGITDETNHLHELIGEDYIHELIMRYRDLPADELSALIMKELEKHRMGTDRYDDCTVVVIKRNLNA